ncbi:cobalt/nickel transport protein, partial [Candidatus Hakubella thermalkaliphila]
PLADKKDASQAKNAKRLFYFEGRSWPGQAGRQFRTGFPPPLLWGTRRRRARHRGRCRCQIELAVYFPHGFDGAFAADKAAGGAVVALLIAGVVLLAVIPLVLVSGSEFPGADGLAEEAIYALRPGYEPWASLPWEPPGGETEGLLFVLQAAPWAPGSWAIISACVAERLVKSNALHRPVCLSEQAA